MIKDLFVIFKPINKFGDIDYTRKPIIYDTGYLDGIDIVRLGRRQRVYVVYRVGMKKTYISCKTYQISIGVSRITN